MPGSTRNAGEDEGPVTLVVVYQNCQPAEILMARALAVRAVEVAQDSNTPLQYFHGTDSAGYPFRVDVGDAARVVFIKG